MSANEPRECLCAIIGGEENCPSCLGTGKVWPSVEGEIVVEVEADLRGSKWVVPEHGCQILVPSPGRYRVIVQKVGE